MTEMTETSTDEQIPVPQTSSAKRTPTPTKPAQATAKKAPNSATKAKTTTTKKATTTTKPAATPKTATTPKAAAARKPAAAKNATRKNVSPEERWRMTSEAAYLRAEKRGFVGGDPADDWLAAEAEVAAKLD